MLLFFDSVAGMKWLEDINAEELSDQFRRLSRAARERVQEEVDVEELSKQLGRLSSRARQRVVGEIDRRRRPRRSVPWGWLIAGGVGIGIGVSLLATRGLTSLLYHVAPADPATFVAVPLLLALTGLAAAWVPALQASRADPAVALRAE